MNAHSQGLNPLSTARFASIIITLTLGCGILNLVVATWILPHWSSVGWHVPVRKWFFTNGYPVLGLYWGLIYIRLPEWVLATIIGFCIGGIFGRKWPLVAIPCAVAFVVADDLALLITRDAETLFAFPLRVRIGMYLWESVAASDLLCCVSVFRT